MPVAAKKREALDFHKFPPGSVTEYRTILCLACTFDVFTTQMGLSPRTAYTAVRAHSPTVQELTSSQPTRPYFFSEDKKPRCPYCNSASRWHAHLVTHRIEGGKLTDAPRRELIKSLPKSAEQFQVFEEKTTRKTLFFEWLNALGEKLELDSDIWLLEAARAYLQEKDPKTNWDEAFQGVETARRSRRLEEGWNREGNTIYLGPALYDEVLPIQYLVSRSHRHGARTFEGRVTLVELVRRLRYTGHLKEQGITDRNQFDVLEKLVEHLTGGDQAVKLYYVFDRRDLLDKVKTVYAEYQD